MSPKARLQSAFRNLRLFSATSVRQHAQLDVNQRRITGKSVFLFHISILVTLSFVLLTTLALGQANARVFVVECEYNGTTFAVACSPVQEINAPFDNVVSQYRSRNYQDLGQFLSSTDLGDDSEPIIRAFENSFRRASQEGAQIRYIGLWRHISSEPFSFAAVGITEIEDVNQPIASFASSSSDVDEHSGTRNLSVNIEPPQPAPIALTFRLSGDATREVDYSIPGVNGNNGSISVSANQNSVSIPVAIVDDSDDESDETLVLTLTPGDGYTVGSRSTHTLTIEDNDDPAPIPVISIRSSNSATAKEDGHATFTLTANPPPTESLEVTVNVTDQGSVAASGETGARPVTIGTDGTGTLTVRLASDAAEESDGSLTVTVPSGEGYSAGGASASVTVRVVTSTQDGDVAYVWQCENNDDTTFAYDVDLDCELTQTMRNMSVQDVVRSYETNGYEVVSGPVAEVARFNQRYNVENCVFLYRFMEAGTFRYSDVVVCPVPLRDPVITASDEQKNAVQGTIAAVAAATVSNVTSNIGARFSAPSTGGASVSLAGMPVIFGSDDLNYPGQTSLADRFDSFGEHAWQSRQRTMSGSELLRSSSFEIALGAAQSDNAALPGTRLTVWGRGDFQFFESGGGRNSGYDGGIVAGYLGADFTTPGGWLTGLAVSRISAEADYTLADAEGSGKLEAELTNIHPYIRFAVDDTSEAWAILGLGSGEVTDTAKDGPRNKSDMSMKMASAGARHLLSNFIGIDWALLADGSLATVETDEGVQSVDGISADVWRARVGAEASYTTVWDSGASLTSFLEIAARQDGGDGTEGVGLELSPGLSLSDSESGFTVQARGRALALHSADNHREYGASITVSKSATADGQGLSLALTPTWGTPDKNLDPTGATGLFPRSANDVRSDALSLNSRIAYGFAAGKGVVSPFAELSLHQDDSRQMRIGSRYSLGHAVDLELFGAQSSYGSGDAEHSMGLTSRIRF